MTTPVYDTVASLASDRFAVSNAAGDSFVAEFAPGLRLRADCGADGVLLGTVASSSHDAETGRTVVVVAMDSGAALTANLAGVLHGNDLPESLCAHAALHAIGGRDALPAASTGVSGLVSLASVAETKVATETAKAVTPAGLAAAAKGLLAANTTIYVATTGSDATGDGSSAAPYASIAKALSSIAGKLIASGVTITIQLADGTYTTSNVIVIDHPDADKIQILGNMASDTTVSISSIDTTACTITVTGNYLTNVTSTKNIQAGDIIGLTGSSTSGLNGAYLVSGVNYTGTNTVVTCSSETFISDVVGGGSIVIKPSNKVLLHFSGSNGLSMSNGLKQISGIKLKGSTINSYVGVLATSCSYYLNNIILDTWSSGLQATVESKGSVAAITVLGCKFGLYAYRHTTMSVWGTTYVSSCSVSGLIANKLSEITCPPSNIILRNNTVNYSPPVSSSTPGNTGSYITSST